MRGFSNNYEFSEYLLETNVFMQWPLIRILFEFSVYDGPGWTQMDPDRLGLLCFPSYQSYFIGGLQCEFILNFFQEYISVALLHN